MSLIFFDGFDWNENGVSVSASAPYAYGWDEANVDLWYGADKTGANAGSTGIFPVYLIKYINQNISTLFFALNFRPTANGNTNPFFRFIDGPTTQCAFGMNSTQNLTFYRGPGTTLIETSTNSLTLSTYYWICGKVTFGTTGSYELRVNGTTWLSGSSVNTITTGNSYCNKFSIGVTSSPAYTVDDFILYDNTGIDTPFNNFITVRQVITKRINSDDVTTGWTSSSSPIYTGLDEVTVNGDTDYAVSDLNTTPATFGHSSDFPTIGAFDAVKVHALVRSEEATSRNITGAIKIGSTVYTGTGSTTFPSKDYKDCYYQFESNPATSAKISGLVLNNSKIGVSILT